MGHKLSPPNAVLYDDKVVRLVNRFFTTYQTVDTYVTNDWELVLVDFTEPENELRVHPDEWLPEHGDFYVHKEAANGRGKDEQKAQGGNRK